MSNHYRLTDPDEMIQYLRDYAIVKNEPTIADAAEMMERMQGRSLIAIVYDLSIMRWANERCKGFQWKSHRDGGGGGKGRSGA